MSKKIALITGVGPGTGSSIARRFSDGGYKVAMIARDKERLKSLEDELEDSKGYSCELRNQEYLNSTIDNIIKDFGYPDVFIHHAIAGWPNWEEYGNIIGGRFLYQEGNVRGVKKSDSGYRHDIKYKVIKDGKHPITEGIEDFEITDELYLAEFFEDDINPILRPIKSQNIISATGLLPARAAPAAVPAIPASEIGISIHLSRPNSSCKPPVTPKTPPTKPGSA